MEKLSTKYGFEQKIFTAKDGKTLNYCRRIVNADAAGDDDMPVLMYLHGAGERGSENDRPLVHCTEVVDWCERNHIKALLLYPQCPDEMQWVNTPWVELSHRMPEISEPLRLAKEMLDYEIESTGGINSKRIYIAGISMGGYGTWDMICRYPEYFAAAFPICGGADVTRAADLVNIPITTYHGDCDHVVPVSRSRDIVRAITEAGGRKIRYVELPGRLHDSWLEAFGDDANWQWLFSSTKE
jgi:predicted peptidase